MYILVHVSVLLETLLKMSHGFLSLWFFSKKLHKVVTRHEGLLLKVRFSWETQVLKLWLIYFFAWVVTWQNKFVIISAKGTAIQKEIGLPLLHIMYCFSMLPQFLREDQCETKSESSVTYNLPLIIYLSSVCQLFRDAYWFLGFWLFIK